MLPGPDPRQDPGATLAELVRPTIRALQEQIRTSTTLLEDVAEHTHGEAGAEYGKGLLRLMRLAGTGSLEPDRLAAPALPASRAGRLTAGDTPMRILLISSHTIMREVCPPFLEEKLDCRVETAPGGVEGWQRAGEEPWDAVLMEFDLFDTDFAEAADKRALLTRSLGHPPPGDRAAVEAAAKAMPDDERRRSVGWFGTAIIAQARRVDAPVVVLCTPEEEGGEVPAWLREAWQADHFFPETGSADELVDLLRNLLARRRNPS